MTFRSSPRPAWCWMWAAILIAVSALPAWAEDDPILAAAEKYVRQSDRYMHHSRLRRGMKGYGLTVMAGTKIVRFGVEIVSVVPNWAPHRSVILAMCSGQDLETSGVISGMSGSPIFIRDTDGKDKMIGALAYGWRSQKRPLCGVQPITYMLSLKEVASALPALKAAVPKAGPHTAVKASAGMPTEEFLRQVLDPQKRDFSRFGWPERLLARPAAAPGVAGLADMAPLTMPMMVSGVSPQTMRNLADSLAPAGIVPVAAGTVGSAQAEAARSAKLEPGGGLAVALVTGDADMSAVGTVTEMVGHRAIGFGHSMFAEGELALPIGPAYIHTVVAGLVNSFKLGSTLRISGTLDRDEECGVTGLVGPKVPMTPLTITVDWKGANRHRVYRYQVATHPMLTARLIQSLILNSATAWRMPPEFHTVRHTVEVEYEKLGLYKVSNVSTNMGSMEAASDAARPISALLNNPYGPAPRLKRIDVKLQIEPTNRLGRLVDFTLDGTTFRPGEMVAGVATLQPFRKDRVTVRLGMRLPADLPEGRYALTVCDDITAVTALQQEMPQRFRPRNVQQLFDSIRRTVAADAGRIYLRIRLPGRGGMALEQTELPDLPSSKAGILAEAQRLKTRTYSLSLVGSVTSEYVFRGSTTVSFDVRRTPNETLTRERTK